MRFWHKLFGRQTAVEPDPMEEEIRRLDAIEALGPKSGKEAYWRTLHPLVQAYWVCRVDWKHEEELPISAGDASSVFHRWGYPVGSYSFHITARQQELMERYGSIREELWQQSVEADRRFGQIEAEGAREKERAWQAYREHFQMLPPQLQCLAAWELAKRSASPEKSGFGGSWKAEIPAPFSFCGWTAYQDPHWGEMGGVAFRVMKPCFGGRNPLLYYTDDDGWPCAERENLDLALIQQYSSGISKLRVEQRRCKDWNGEEKERRVVLFELDPSAIRESLPLNGNAVSTKDAGEYIFVLPRSGEFYCVLGEVRDGEMIALHRDDFCMK